MHKQGFDSNGDQGVDFFNIGKPTVVSNSKNSTAASVTAEWTATRASDSVAVTITLGTDANGNTTLSFEGLKLTVETTPAPAAKDGFLVKLVQNAINDMSVAITSESQIAAAGATGGESDNRNAQKLLNLQDVKLVGGNATLA